MTGAKGGGGGGGGDYQPFPVKEQLPGVDFCVNSSPSWPEAIFLGFQHYLVMLGTTVLIPTILVPQMGGGRDQLARVIQTLLFVAGINTLLQTFVGCRLPVVIGGSYAFVIPATTIIFSHKFSNIIDPHERFLETMRAIQGAVMFASIFPILIGFFGIWRIVVRFINPLSAVPLVTLTGLGLFSLAFPQLAKCVQIGLPALLLLVLFSQYLSQYWKSGKSFGNRFSIPLAIGLAWAFAEILTAAGAYKNSSPATQFSCKTDSSGLIKAAPWIRIPYPFEWGRPTLNIANGFAVMAATLVALVESTGTLIAAARYGSATPIPPSIVSRSAGWLGVGILLDGAFGTTSGSTASVENAGLLAVHRVGSRRVVQVAAVFMLFFSILGKFGAVLASIPLPIFAAIYCVLFAYVASAGLGLLQFCNLNSFRTKFIVGFSLFMGLSVTQYFNEFLLITGRSPVHTKSMAFNSIMQVIFSSPPTVAIMIALFLDLTLHRRHSDTRRDSGRHWWHKYRYFNTDPRSDEFYSLPFNMNKFFPPV